MSSTTTTKVNLSLAYADSSSRTITFNNVAQEQYINIASRVKAINENMSDAFKTTFRSNDNAQVVSIAKAQVITTEEEVIYSAN